jgi:hypothetical protein
VNGFAYLWRTRFVRLVVGLVVALLLVRVGAWALPGAGGSGPGKDFDHGATRFPLTGPHTKVACESCHPSAGDTRQWKGVPTDCHGCHGDRTNHRGTLGTQCEQCHTATAWTSLRYDAASHHFPLTGPHDRPCVACHAGGTHIAPTVTCRDCHAKKHGGTDAECSTCHQTSTWLSTFYKHDFPPERLPGPHVTAPCLGCHPGYQFKGTSFSCVSCHLKDLKHDNLGECSRCHDSYAWSRTSKVFDHDAPALGFALTEGHKGVACSECHQQQAFGSAPRACEGCHQKTPHADLGPCAPCHTTTTFKKADFSHDATRFPLDARHAKVGCAECHTRVPPGSFTPGPGACETCHRDPHGGQFWQTRGAKVAGASCADCHATPAFVPSTIDASRHAAFSFPLRGAHATTPCSGCHARASPGAMQVFVGTPSACVDCHGDHHKGLLGTDCASCHGAATWKGATAFDHAKTGFTLQGAHAAAACDECHVNGAKLTTADRQPPSCASCHTSRHGVAFGSRCTECHDTTRFADARGFDHSATMFPLERRHKAIPCASCHTPNVARPPDPNCRSCHGDPHGGRTTLDCGDCHRPDNWLLVRYDHDKAEFPLKGKHFFTPCKDCHTNDVWSGLRRECVSCHRGDAQFANMRVPGHAAYTWDCIDCHRPWSWSAKP